MLGIFMITALSGCGAGAQVDLEQFSDLSIGEAREIQNAQLQEFIDMVPADQVVEVWGPIPEMGAMSCDTDLEGNRPFWREETGTYMLPGGADIYIGDTLDVSALLNEIADRQSGFGWTVDAQGQQSTDGPDLLLESPDGFSYFLSHIPETFDGKNALMINSFSPCILPPSDFDVFEDY
jgi:hypothetical protein